LGGTQPPCKVVSGLTLDKLILTEARPGKRPRASPCLHGAGPRVIRSQRGKRRGRPISRFRWDGV